MTRDREDLVGALLPPLDDQPGPMPQLSASEADAIAWGAVSRWAARVPGVEPADDGLGPAQPMAAEHAQRLAQEVVRARTLRASRRSAPWLLKAAVALLACGLAGVTSAAYRLWPSLPPLDTSSQQRQVRTPSAQPHKRRVTAPVTPTTDRAPEPAAAAAPPVQPADAAVPTAEPTPEAPVAAQTAPVPEPKSTAQPNLTQPPALEELLANANALRAQRRWVAAERVYRQALAAGAPDQQRYVALVAAAGINLQHLGRPERALALYQSALSLMPRGELSEQAQLGIAECQRALGDMQAELRALQQFSLDHPHSWMIEDVSRRRAELEASPGPEPR